MEIEGKRVTLMGLGRFGGGAAAARWLLEQGARLTIADRASVSSLQESLCQLDGAGQYRLYLGEHRERDFRETDMIVVNPAVRPDHPMLAVAREAQVALTSEMELFLDACPAPIVGVTGSNGKSTTAAMIAAILETHFDARDSSHAARRVWLGGNIGRSLLLDLPSISKDDVVVLEISSFQLQHLSRDASLPETAVCTNCTTNHLDWHGTWERYVAAKQGILRGQRRESRAVLNLDCREVSTWTGLVRGELFEPVPDAEVPRLAVPGRHNRRNACLAVTAARAFGASDEAIATALGRFRTLPQRLQWIGRARGIDFYNDSTSTTPESTLAASTALDRPAWFLVGGSDKGIDFAPLCRVLAARAAGVACFGATRRRLYGLLDDARPHGRHAQVETIEEALLWCWARASAGEAVVLSPACASHDQFQSFRHRGEVFDRLVDRLVSKSEARTRREA